MAEIKTLTQFRDYVKSRLGYPVIQVEVEDTQLDEIIEDSVQDFTRYNYGEGAYIDYLVINLSANVNEYTVTDTRVIDVIEMILNSNDGLGGINSLFSPMNALLGVGSANNWWSNNGLTNTGVVDYNIAMTWLAEINNQFGTGQYFLVDFLQSSGYEGARILKVLPTPTEAMVGLFRVYKKGQDIYLYNHPLVKKLVVARSKIQWGTHLSKFGMALPGGGTIDGVRLITEGKDEEEKAMKRIYDESEKPDIFIG